MRRKLIQSDLLECVLGLGPNLFYNSPMEACVMVCRTHKPPERWGKVLFINAVGEVTRERAQSFLRDDHIERIVAACRDFRGLTGFAHVATLDEIRAHGSSLSIPLYARPAGLTDNEAGGPSDSLATAIAEWQASSEALRAAMNDLFATLAENDLPRS